MAEEKKEGKSVSETTKDSTSTTTVTSNTNEPASGDQSATTTTKDESVPKEEKKVEVPKEFKALIETIEKLSVLELHQLVKVMEEKFDVSAQAVAVAAPGTSEGDAVEEQNSFTVELKDVGAQKIAVIKAVKAILGLGLKEAKDLVDGAPSVMKEGVKKAEAEEIKTEIEKAGGTVELK